MVSSTFQSTFFSIIYFWSLLWLFWSEAWLHKQLSSLQFSSERDSDELDQVSILFKLVTDEGPREMTKTQIIVNDLDRLETSVSNESMFGRSRWWAMKLMKDFCRPQALVKPPFNEVQNSSLQGRKEWPKLKCFLFVSIDSKRVFAGQSQSERVDVEQGRAFSRLSFTQTSRLNAVLPCYLQDRRECPELKCFISVWIDFWAKGHR